MLLLRIIVLVRLNDFCDCSLYGIDYLVSQNYTKGLKVTLHNCFYTVTVIHRVENFTSLTCSEALKKTIGYRTTAENFELPICYLTF